MTSGFQRPNAVQLRVSIDRIEPQIRRRLLVPADNGATAEARRSAMNQMVRSHVCTLGSVAIVIAFANESKAQDKKPAPPEKWATCSSLKKEDACNAGRNCSWVAERKDEKGTVKRKAYCRSSPNAQKDDAKKQ